MFYNKARGSYRRIKLTLLSSCMIVTLLLLSSCEASPQATQVHTQPTATASPTRAVVATPTSTSTIQTASPPDDDIGTMRAIQRQMRGPDGWTWQTSLPDHRLVIFYGNPLSAPMGPLGQYSDADLLAKLQDQAQVYEQLDPTHPVVSAFDYVTPVVQADPMADGTWVYRMPSDSIEHYIDLANSHHSLFFFDMQVGHSSVQHEVEQVWSYLQRPGVDLALDPEFDLPPGAIPDHVFGHMSSTEINWAIDQLSNLVLTKHLPPKVLIIHQFLQEMLPDWQNIKLKPGVEVVTCVDGFGTPEEKIGDYQTFDKAQLIQYPGMKLFYKLDAPLMTPEATLALDPSPLMVMYQ